MSKKTENILLALLLIVSAVPRFWGLGASHFYGDETKTLYLDKTVPAITYFLDQRKGPFQFFVTWVVEKLSGGFSELWMRLPFAFAGLLSVLVFYLLVKKLFDSKVAFVASLLYSFSGFSIAFSRTVQYQSFLILFGLLGMLLFLYYLDDRKKSFLVLSSLAYVLALYCHYDAIFYLFPVVFLISREQIKEVALYFITPIIVLVSIFYVPYLYWGYFATNTVGYLSRRLLGDAGTLPNSSRYTLYVYNPYYMFLYLLTIGSAASIRKVWGNRFLIAWFLLPYVLFEIVFKNPGTHILEYLMSVYIFTAVGMIGFKEKAQTIFATLALSLIITAQITFCFLIFVFNINYPWAPTKFFTPAGKSYQLFLYGFPYNRSWPQIAEYLNAQKGARGFYTNDNTVVAKYYVKKLDVTMPASNFYPQYYVYVYNNQEFKYPDDEFLSHYTEVQKIGTDAVIYLRN